MGFKCGIVGLPNVGKSTLFNALTNSSKAQAENFPFCTIDPNVGIVSVPDERLSKISAISKSIKTINDIIFAIPNNNLNKNLFKHLKSRGLKVFLGSDKNVLDRYFKAAKKQKHSVNCLCRRRTHGQPFNQRYKNHSIYAAGTGPLYNARTR